ncbi:hypothetical protein ABPG75_006475 [Micractinium tetrahymenae]
MPAQAASSLARSLTKLAEVPKASCSKAFVMRSQPLHAASSSTAAFTAAAARPAPRLLAWHLQQHKRPAHSAHPHAAAVAQLCSAAPDSSLQQPTAASRPPSYQQAHAASLSRATLRWEALVAQLSAGPAATASEQSASRLQRLRQRLESSAALPPFQDSFDRGGGRVEVTLEEWQAVAHQRPAGFDSQARLAVPSVADAAVVTRGGRYRGYWKGANQDAYSLSAPAGDMLLLSVCDGHGRSGELASRAAADGLAAALPGLLSSSSSGSRSSGSSDGGGSNGGSSDAATAASQHALVAAFQQVGGSMQRDPAFAECGAAVVACLLQRDSLTVAWAGDCRAVLGMCVGIPEGPRCLVHPLTQDHKPGSPLERARIAASGRGRVVQREPGQPFRITGSPSYPTPNSLSLSRGFGDTWAVPLGLTAEPDAVTLTLPPPYNFSSSSSSASSGELEAASFKLPPPSGLSASSSGTSTMAGSLCWSVDSSSDSDEAASSSGSSTDGVDRLGSRAAEPAAQARHVLVLACDGLWDMLTNEEAVGIALSCVSAEAAAHALVHAARRRWAAAYCGLEMDDITAAVAFLPC